MAGDLVPAPPFDWSNSDGNQRIVMVIYAVFPYLLVGLVVIQLLINCFCYRRQRPPLTMTEIEAQPLPSAVNTAVINAQSSPRPLSEDEERRAKEIEKGCSECAVCLVDFADDQNGVVRRMLKPCGHRFHQVCVDEWLVMRGHTCPICRGVSQDSSLTVHSIDQV